MQMQHSLHNQIINNSRESTAKNNDINREVETALNTIKKTVDELTESTDQINKFKMKIKMNLQVSKTKSNHIKVKLNSVSSSAL